MASAAQQVFAIPELIEHIILFIYENSLNVADETHSKELFTLQRVSRSFNNTIKGSTRLKFKMGVGFPLPADNVIVRSQGLVSPYLKNKALHCDAFVCGEVKEYLDVKCRSSTLSEDAIDTLYDVATVHYSTTFQSSNTATQEDAGFAGIHNRRYSARHHSWRRLKASTPKVTFWADIHVSFQNPNEKSNGIPRWSSYGEILVDETGQLTLGEIADMLNTISQRTLLEHAALEHYVQHRKEAARDADYVPFATHEMAKRFLHAACMHVAWMSFEYDPAMRSLNKAMASRPMFWASSATNDLDQKLRGNRKIELRKLYTETESEDPSPMRNMGVVDVMLGALTAIDICAVCLILGLFLWLLGRWGWS